MAGSLNCLPCVDADARAAAARSLLDISRDDAKALGQTAVVACARGSYVAASGRVVDWREEIQQARALKRSIPPDAPLATFATGVVSSTEVQVCNETTLQAGRRLLEQGRRPLALNLANGVTPGGGFLNGDRTQEESLCRASALYETLEGDPMYAFHRGRPEPDSSDWMILSPQVPVFRDDTGLALEQPWLLDFLSAAAPYAPKVGQPRSGELLQQRIHRALAVSASHGYQTLVLGAWGCGSFGNDPARTAMDFRAALEGEFAGCFEHIVFAITDGSTERRMLGPFRDVFRATGEG